MNAGWPIWLILTLALPIAGRLMGRPGHAGGTSVRRACAHLLHLAALATCTLLAAQAGGPSADHPDWDNSSALIALLGGILWVEGSLLVGLRPAPSRSGRMRADRADASGSGSTTPGSTRPESATELRAEGARALLDRILRLEHLPVDEIMTPRERIVLADSTEPLTTTLQRMRVAGHSRLPVAAGSPDRILGVIHAKDLVPLSLHGERPATLRRHLRRYLNVPAGQSVARLLEDFRRHRVHIGIVSDSLGVTVGLVTVTDVFRFIAGATERGAARPSGTEVR